MGSRPDFTKRGSVDDRLKEQAASREAEAEAKAREATAEMVQATAAAVVVQRATRKAQEASAAEAAAKTKIQRELEAEQATHPRSANYPSTFCTPPGHPFLLELCTSSAPSLHIFRTHMRPARIFCSWLS